MTSDVFLGFIGIFLVPIVVTAGIGLVHSLVKDVLR